MKVKALGKDWEVNDLEFKDKKKLVHQAMKLYPDGENKPMDSDVYEEISDKVLELSGLKEKDFDDFSMTQVLVIIDKVFLAYGGFDIKKSGA